VRFLAQDADEGVEVRVGGAEASSSCEDAWLGARARPAVLRGAYCLEAELRNDCLLRVGWGAANSRRALGTDERSFGYGGTGMKSHGNKFEPYGKVHEGMTGAVLTCLLDRRDPRRQTISYMLNGEDLGVAFRPPLWMAEVPLFPAVCGREDWCVRLRGRGFRFPPPEGYRPLADLRPEDGAGEEGAYEAARELFAPAPREERRELQQLDVPEANLVELRSQGDETLDPDLIWEWLEKECEVARAACHMEFSESLSTAVAAFVDHRAARSLLGAPPPNTTVLAREAFSEAAEELLRSRRPEDRGGTTDRVARRFIAGALADDDTLTRDQLRRIRRPSSPKGEKEAESSRGKASGRPRERSWRSRSRPERPGAAARLRPSWRDGGTSPPRWQGGSAGEEAGDKAESEAGSRRTKAELRPRATPGRPRNALAW